MAETERLAASVIVCVFVMCFCFLVQVANLNPKDNSYSLKEFIFRDVQRDWPGYNDDERTQLDRLLTR